jgi:hypothetical protein
MVVRKPLPKKKIKEIEPKVVGEQIGNNFYTKEQLLSVFREDVCHNPVKYLDKECQYCLFFEPCRYYGKGDYAKRKNRPVIESVTIPEITEEVIQRDNDRKKKEAQKKVSPPKVKSDKANKVFTIPELD